MWIFIWIGCFQLQLKSSSLREIWGYKMILLVFLLIFLFFSDIIKMMLPSDCSFMRNAFPRNRTLVFGMEKPIYLNQLAASHTKSDRGYYCQQYDVQWWWEQLQDGENCKHTDYMHIRMTASLAKGLPFLPNFHKVKKGNLFPICVHSTND